MAEISIKPEREYLHEIVTKIKKGIYGVPSFQRSFVWRKEQVLDLFDSIQHGYPIGSILLWKPEPKQFPLKSRDIITDEIDEESKPEYYILDGRQRLTSFYCSVLHYDDKKDIFNICYNLEKECFEYVKKPQLHILKVSDLYDTFLMLEKLQQIMDYYKNDQDKAQTYVDRARKINSVLQSYQIGEMLLENCDINEASTVFSRLNSKGTDISKVSMLQAVFYKSKEDVLISDSINEFINSLAVYGFETLKSDDILNCCYRYVGKNFYDTQLLKDLDKLDFTPHWNEIKEDISNTVKFLHDECYVISGKLLPYVKQLIALAGFFKEHKNPTYEQRQELKKWFFYTTYNQSFLNGSLTIVRTLLRRFERFIVGDEKTAIEYESIEIGSDSLNFRYATGSALSNFMVLSLVYKYISLNQNADIVFCDPIKMYRNDPRGVIPYFRTEDRIKVINLQSADSHFHESYAISQEMIKNVNDKECFCKLREKIILEIERELLKYVGLECS
ncbi:DUF262 domain-containing protein [Bacteroides sp.]|uniref:DUF262 domain-containing protein n=1 Tax=Bacteroides sp. TaxID=29523 RepID=UPI0025C0BBAD|nr:DUF262 domain-containing protein [Bacteroides sp.]